MRFHDLVKKLVSGFIVVLLCATSAFSIALAQADVILGKNPANSDAAENCDVLLVKNTDTREILRSKNTDMQYTFNGKPVLWMLVLSALDYLDMSETVVVETRDFGLPDNSKVLGLRRDHSLTVRDLVAATVLNGDLDAAIVLRNTAMQRAVAAGAATGEVMGDELAEQKKPSLEYKDFVLLMDKKAVSLGMTNTHYSSALGFADEAQKTTASDQLLLTDAIMADKALFRIMRIEQYSFEITNKQIPASIKNTEINMDTKSVYYDKRVKAAACGSDHNGVMELIFAQGDAYGMIGILWCSNATKNEGAALTKQMLDQYTAIEEIDIYNAIAQKARNASFVYQGTKIVDLSPRGDSFVRDAYKGFKFDDKQLTLELDESTVCETETDGVEIMANVLYQGMRLGNVQLTTDREVLPVFTTPVPVYSSVEMGQPTMMQQYGWLICIGAAAILGLLMYLLGGAIKEKMK